MKICGGPDHPDSQMKIIFRNLKDSQMKIVFRNLKGSQMKIATKLQKFFGQK